MKSSWQSALYVPQISDLDCSCVVLVGGDSGHLSVSPPFALLYFKIYNSFQNHIVSSSQLDLSLKATSVLQFQSFVRIQTQMKQLQIIEMLKTKYLRFGKPHRLDTLHPKTTQQIHPSDSSPLRSRADPFTSGQSFDLQDLMNLLRKNKGSGDCQLQPRDRSVVVDLPDLDESQDIPMDALKSWISQVCTKVVSSAFNLLLSDKLSYDQAKVSCSEGILRNIVLLVERYRLDKGKIQEINKHIEENVVPYLKRKYPMTESSDVNKSLDDSVKPTDKTDALENDLLFKSGVIFKYDKDGNYNQTIMEFLNWLMSNIDSKDENSQEDVKSVYQEFYDYMSGIFQNVYSQTWTTRKARESLMKNSNNEQSKINNVGLFNSEVIAQNIPTQKYAEQVKQYTNYIIGRKISKNVPTYSEEEIEEGHLTIKSPAVLRILTKWCEELEAKFKKKNWFLDREENLRVQENGGNINTMFMWMKIPLNEMIEEEKGKIKSFMQEITLNNFDQQTELLKQELDQNDGFYHIDKIEKVCGKFATKTVSNLHSYIVLYLNRLIHGLLTVARDLYEQRLSSKARWSSPPDLLTFKVGDLMRCKCSSKEKQILYIYQELQSISKLNPKVLKIIRVKNRLKLGTNDILINVLYKNKYICEIQLAVNSKQSKFISCSNAWNHYIYQLGRTIFGPITELSSVWMSLDPRSTEYAHVIANQKTRTVKTKDLCPGSGQNHEFQTHERPFICSNCKIAYSHSNYFWDHQKCQVKGCGYMICATCRIDEQKQEKLKEKLLKGEEVLLNACKDIVNRRSTNRVLPKYGVCIPINSKKIKIQRFIKLQLKNIMTIFGIETDHHGKQKVIKISEIIKDSAEQKFLTKFLVFQIPEKEGKNLVDITLERAKKECIIPAKVKEVYKKEKEILSLIDQHIDDSSIKIVAGKPESMKHIKNLQLADNQLTNISFLVNNFYKLERLQLSRNKVIQIDGVSQLRHLQKLNLRNNKLTSLPDQLCLLKYLKGLNIRFNKITGLPQNFGDLKELEKLESDNNQIAQLPPTFNNLTNLAFIDLSKNKLTKFPQSIRGFSKLSHLALAKNKLGLLPEWIEEFKEVMANLDLYKTALSNFPDGLFCLKKLTVLKIQSDHDSLSPQIGKMSTLKEFVIQMKNLKKLPESIFKLKELQLLEIEDCYMSQLPDCLSEMKNLKSFGLINNKLDKLSEQLTQMVGLRDLRLEGQNLPTFPENLTLLQNLRTLSLSNNKLINFPKVILKFPKLYSLNLKNTQLQNIPNDLLKHLPELQELNLENNNLTSLPLSLVGAKKLRERKFKYDKDKIKMEQELSIVLTCFQQALIDKTFLERAISLGHKISRQQSNNDWRQ